MLHLQTFLCANLLQPCRYAPVQLYQSRNGSIEGHTRCIYLKNSFVVQHTKQTANIIIYLHSVGGYDCECVDVPRHDDYCVICLLPARDPQQTKCECAKLYCKSCYDKLKSTSGKCPTCHQPMDAFPNRKGQRPQSEVYIHRLSLGK